MLATAKVFTNGHSQAIRLPKAFRVDVDEMWIARNEVTGEITLKPKDTQTLRQRRLDAWRVDDKRREHIGRGRSSVRHHERTRSQMSTTRTSRSVI